MADSSDYLIEVDKNKTFFYRIVSTHNGQTLLVSEGYKTKWGVKRAAKRFAAVNNLVVREVF